MKLDFFVKLKYQSSAIILSVINKYSVCDLLCDVIYNACKEAIYVTYGIWCPVASARLSKL